MKTETAGAIFDSVVVVTISALLALGSIKETTWALVVMPIIGARVAGKKLPWGSAVLALFLGAAALVAGKHSA